MSNFRVGQGLGLNFVMMAAALALSLVLATSAKAVGFAQVTFGLDNPVVTDNSVSVDVMALVTTDSTEAINSFGLDVSNSSPSLAPGGDYSAFSFTPSSPLLDNWSDASVLPNDSFFDYATFSPSANLLESASPYNLGTLSVDLTATSVAQGETATISIFRPTGTYAFYEIFPYIELADIDFFLPDFEFTRPLDDDGGDDGDENVIPEPASMMLAGLAIAVLTGAATRRRRA